jgi:hypothetical protein
VEIFLQKFAVVSFFICIFAAQTPLACFRTAKNKLSARA